MSITLWNFLRHADGSWHRWPQTKAGPVMLGRVPAPWQCGETLIVQELFLTLSNRRPVSIDGVMFRQYPLNKDRFVGMGELRDAFEQAASRRDQVQSGVISLDTFRKPDNRKRYQYDPTPSDIEALRKVMPQFGRKLRLL